MKIQKKRRLRIVIVAVVVFIMMGYSPLITYLTDQAKNPSGMIGQLITSIWATYFNDLSDWSNNLININASSTVLDIGYGGGSNVAKLYSSVDDIHIQGIDISSESFKTASKKNHKGIELGDINLIVGDVADLPYEESMFDYVFSIQSHMYWDRLDEGIRQCLRTLKNNGILVITSEIDKIDYHLPEFKVHEKFKGHLLMLGFTDVKIVIEGNYVGFICKK